MHTQSLFLNPRSPFWEMVELDDGLLAVEELGEEAEVAALHSQYALSQLDALQ